MLAHDPEALSERSPLYNGIMFGAKGLPRADRELGAVAASRINGCSYCASVHAKRFTELTKAPEVMERIQHDGVEAALDPRRKAILDYSAKLTRDPAAIGAGRRGAAARAGPERSRDSRSHPRGRDVRLGEPADADARRAGGACTCRKSAVTPVIFLHGIGGSARVFAPQIASFAAAGYQPVALDLPGYGDRTPVEAMSFEALAEDVEFTIAQNALEKPVLVGHSMGGMVVQTMLRRRPDDYRAAVLSCTSPAFGNPAGDFQKKFVADRLAPLEAGRTMADIAPDAAAGIDGPERRSRRQARCSSSNTR